MRIRNLGRNYPDFIWFRSPESESGSILHEKLLCTCVTSVADPDPGSRVFLTPGSRMGRISASGSEMNNPDHVFYSLETIYFWVTILKFFDADPGWRQFGSWIRNGKKSGPGSGINIPDPQHIRTCVHISAWKKEHLSQSKNPTIYVVLRIRCFLEACIWDPGAAILPLHFNGIQIWKFWKMLSPECDFF